MKLPKNHAFKVLDKGRKPNNGGKGIWQKPGTWLEVTGDLIPCENGIHLCREKNLIEWLGPVIWLAEYDPTEIIECNGKIVVRRARLVKQFKTWNAKTARLFACDCAERVLPIFEKQYPNDFRPRNAILASRKFANGKISKNSMDAAWDAAGDAARAAARDAAWAAWDAADAAGAERKWQTRRLMKILEGE